MSAISSICPNRKCQSKNVEKKWEPFSRTKAFCSPFQVSESKQVSEAHQTYEALFDVAVLKHCSSQEFVKGFLATF